jgi:glycerophosphoryl diester phosphodiesterase
MIGLGVGLLVAVLHAAPPVVIAHRGASGYLPEHTLEAAAFAYALGADFIEQDVVLSKDGVLVVCHDIHVDTTTDVARKFPGLQRPDGRFYAIDFTWPELRTLQVRERFDEKSGRPVFPGRFPDTGASFRLASMEEEILLVQGLNRSTGRKVGLYPEIKAPAWHAGEKADPGRALLELLARHGYTEAADNIFVQCFEAAELKRLRHELKSRLKLVQLVEERGPEFAAMLTPAGLREVATYAQGIGPSLRQVVTGLRAGETPRPTPFVADAHAVGLVVHPYTFRVDALPAGVSSPERLLGILLRDAGVDGLFADQPDAVTGFLRREAKP